ncbi:MAG: serine hydrolase [Pyrinomonadaceae bacterium]
MFEQNRDFSTIAIIIFVFLSIFFIVSCATAQEAKKKSVGEQERYRLAADYSREFRGLSVLVVKGGKTVFEDYQNGFSAADSNMLASGTKSFSGVVAAAAIEDGLIKNFDEKVSDTITEWKTDRRKSRITLRQLLSLTSGIDAGSIGRPPGYAEAAKSPTRYDPGTTFQYGPVPFQIFGELMRRKLAPKKMTVMDYLKRRILDPIGLKVADWTMPIEGQPNLPSGAFLTAGEWAKFGRFLMDQGKWNGKQIVSRKLLGELVKGSKANPNYGLTFWLNRSSDSEAKLAEPKNRRGSRLRELLNIRSETDEVSQNGFGKDLPRDIYAAAGAGKQRLYIIPSLDLVVVRQGRQARFDDEEFLRRLIYGEK